MLENRGPIAEAVFVRNECASVIHLVTSSVSARCDATMTSSLRHEAIHLSVNPQHSSN